MSWKEGLRRRIDRRVSPDVAQRKLNAAHAAFSPDDPRSLRRLERATERHRTSLTAEVDRIQESRRDLRKGLESELSTQVKNVETAIQASEWPRWRADVLLAVHRRLRESDNPVVKLVDKLVWKSAMRNSKRSTGHLENMVASLHAAGDAHETLQRLPEVPPRPRRLAFAH